MSSWRLTPPSGVRLDMFYQESADYDAIAGPVDSAPRSSASYITRGFADHYTAVDINGLRQIFLMIPPGAGEVTVRDIAVSEYHNPFTGRLRSALATRSWTGSIRRASVPRR